VNPTTREQSVTVLSGGKLFLNWIDKKLGTEFAVPSQSGLILLQTAYKEHQSQSDKTPIAQ
jgi:hypothetical protein